MTQMYNVMFHCIITNEAIECVHKMHSSNTTTQYKIRIRIKCLIKDEDVCFPRPDIAFGQYCIDESDVTYSQV